MFESKPFNGDISGWKIQDSCVTNNMFDDCPIQEEHKPAVGNPLREGGD